MIDFLLGFLTGVFVMGLQQLAWRRREMGRDRRMKNSLVEIVEHASLTSFEFGLLRDLVRSTVEWDVTQRARAARLMTKYGKFYGNAT